MITELNVSMGTVIKFMANLQMLCVINRGQGTLSALLECIKTYELKIGRKSDTIYMRGTDFEETFQDLLNPIKFVVGDFAAPKHFMLGDFEKSEVTWPKR